ncbi:MAG: hypothetical protein D6727_10535 [Gammaproteobacteria bacterium]|nr:MAG: hypothetical protein D6727_10535 [Gammaproteobacteria bacterium]
MHLILFSRRRGARQYRFSGGLLAGAGALVLAVAGAGFAGGYWFGGGQAAQAPIEEIAALKQELAGYRATVAELRENARENLDALALRVGELNASVIRLNALGRRLTDMAELDDGEFDFDNPPALGGGPELPAYASVTGQVTDLVREIEGLDESLYAQQQQLAVLEGLLLNRKLRAKVFPHGRPVRSGWMSSPFGKRTDPFTGKPGWHRGVDFAGKRGSEVVAVADGVVTWSGDRYGYGKMVEIRHGNGYVTRYAHNEENLVAVGDQVRQGQTIARMGSSGRSTGPHLHFEVWHLGRPVDPRRYIRQTS